MFNKVLVANRGAIACRIFRTLSSMGITSVAVYAQADADSLHVRAADEAYPLGEGAAAQTYLDIDKLLSIAGECGAQAVHPGYGFLSENPEFVSRCTENDIVFIGPATATMQAFGLKHEARSLAMAAGLPMLPGTELLVDLNQALIAASEIGYPVILKSTAGGGGIGMQVCQTPTELEDCYAGVVRLCENNFSDGGVFLEKYIARARHLEVQVFGNGLGEAVALGERDCSLQRRNQKVIEETPAPGLGEGLRAELQQAASELLAGVDYAGAGTVEFIYDTAAEQYYFLEVNTRLQVEHGVTEEVFGVDLVQWMIEQAHAPLIDLAARRKALQGSGHAIQARIYAEDPAAGFRPSAGVLSHVEWPDSVRDGCQLRIDTWVQSGVEVSPLFDPMLAKVIVHAADRMSAITALAECLADCSLYGIETNRQYAHEVLAADAFQRGEPYTALLSDWPYRANTFEILAPGSMTSVQDLPGREGYWHVGIPPSGPFDRNSFSLGNRLLGNSEACAGLEITLQGPTLRFNADARVLVAGAALSVQLDGEERPLWQALEVEAGQTLALGKISGAGARAYLLLSGGIECPPYLGSRSTFTLGGFGGHVGRALRTGDVLHYPPCKPGPASPGESLPQPPVFDDKCLLRVIYGPHGAPDFLTGDDIAVFFDTWWEVHYNSSRTGIRLIGPKPHWARDSGGEAGMHPSNIHDNAYAYGSIDFTGDMPVILGPDGPSLGGFVCPAVVIDADLWKLGQLKAGDRLKFVPCSVEEVHDGGMNPLDWQQDHDIQRSPVLRSPICAQWALADGTEVCVRLAGDRFLLVEFGEQVLDLALRFRVAALQSLLQARYVNDQGLAELTPGIRSLQLHYDPALLPLASLLAGIEAACVELAEQSDLVVDSRTVWLPLSWDDAACQEAVQKYMRSVRREAPWCPDNIEFIRRINGLDSVAAVRDIVFDAQYVVMGLGDVYLGAPVATPLDPRHRLVTTKYNPARTWTAENSVGIGGAYLCVYGMEGPGGYQFIGRTLQMWNRYRRTDSFEEPWLLRCFDRLRFFPVSSEELEHIRQAFPRGDYALRIEPGQFSLADYTAFLQSNSETITAFQSHRQAAFDAELHHWRDSGQLHFEADNAAIVEDPLETLPDGYMAIESAVAGNVWQLDVREGVAVRPGDTLLVLESMKMEIPVTSACAGIVRKIVKHPGSQVTAGQVLLHLELTA